jgi:hypothetical protein
MTFTVHWLRNGTVVAAGAQRRLVEADATRRLACRVTATNGAGSAVATSRSKRAQSAYMRIVANSGLRFDPLPGVPWRRTCRGSMRLTLLNGRRVLGRRTISLKATRDGGKVNCKGSTTFRVRRGLVGSARTLTVSQRFSGNAYIKPDADLKRVSVPRP